jgi:hypothetical protein
LLVGSHNSYNSLSQFRMQLITVQIIFELITLYLWFPYRFVISNSGVIYCLTQHVACSLSGTKIFQQCTPTPATTQHITIYNVISIRFYSVLQFIRYQYFITTFKYILMIDTNNKCFIPESAASSASSTVLVGLMMAMT